MKTLSLFLLVTVSNLLVPSSAFSDAPNIDKLLPFMGSYNGEIIATGLGGEKLAALHLRKIRAPKVNNFGGPEKLEFQDQFIAVFSIINKLGDVLDSVSYTFSDFEYNEKTNEVNMYAKFHNKMTQGKGVLFLNFKFMPNNVIHGELTTTNITPDGGLLEGKFEVKK